MTDVRTSVRHPASSPRAYIIARDPACWDGSGGGCHKRLKPWPCRNRNRNRNRNRIKIHFVAPPVDLEAA
jgi:hypothetical protein